MIVHRALSPLAPATPVSLYRSEPRSLLGMRLLLAWCRRFFV